MRPYRTHQQQSMHDARLKLAIAAAAFIAAEMEPGMTADELAALIRRHTGGDERTALLVSMILADAIRNEAGDSVSLF